MKLSRQQLVNYLLEHSAKKDIQRVAAYLISNGRSKEVDLVIREVESALAERGRTVARVHSARKLGADEQKLVVTMLKQQDKNIASIEIINEIDPYVLGGVKVRTPEMEVDLSIRGRLNRMRHA